MNGKKAADITKFSYVHIFDNEQLDQLLQLICFSDMLSSDDKSDIEIVKDDEGRIVPIEVNVFEGLPIANAYWDPEKYMAEHLNMAFDEPRDIRIKVKNTDYIIIHDWFGDHYEKTDEICED